jgi:hypothetical protein
LERPASRTFFSSDSEKSFKIMKREREMKKERGMERNIFD